MVNILINYANAPFRKSQRLNSSTGTRVGAFDWVISYSNKDIDREFYARNSHILTQARGNGYWLWKPYFIRQTLDLLGPDDCLFYCDSGAYFTQPITPLVEAGRVTGQDVMVFDLVHQEKLWTKRDAFVLMGCDTPRFTESNQRLGGCSLWKKSRFSIDLADEYLRYAQDQRILTDFENQCGQPNYPEFKDHRHDQSIFSLLTKKHQLTAFRDPSQWGDEVKDRYPNSPYGQLIELTRLRHEPFLHQMKRRLCSLLSRSDSPSPKA